MTVMKILVGNTLGKSLHHVIVMTMTLIVTVLEVIQESQDITILLDRHLEGHILQALMPLQIVVGTAVAGLILMKATVIIVTDQVVIQSVLIIQMTQTVNIPSTDQRGASTLLQKITVEAEVDLEVEVGHATEQEVEVELGVVATAEVAVKQEVEVQQDVAGKEAVVIVGIAGIAAVAKEAVHVDQFLEKILEVMIALMKDLVVEILTGLEFIVHSLLIIHDHQGGVKVI